MSAAFVETLVIFGVSWAIGFAIARAQKRRS